MRGIIGNLSEVSELIQPSGLFHSHLELFQNYMLLSTKSSLNRDSFLIKGLGSFMFYKQIIPVGWVVIRLRQYSLKILKQFQITLTDFINVKQLQHSLNRGKSFEMINDFYWAVQYIRNNKPYHTKTTKSNLNNAATTKHYRQYKFTYFK